MDQKEHAAFFAGISVASLAFLVVGLCLWSPEPSEPIIIIERPLDEYGWN